MQEHWLTLRITGHTEGFFFFLILENPNQSEVGVSSSCLRVGVGEE